jgi:hypothetical protein
MRTIRRIYFYAVSLVSLEVALWGLIGLLRTVIKLGPDCTFSNLSLALSLILVGTPLFAFHWGRCQHFARSDEDERPSLIRAGFLYGLLLGTLIPATQNVLALVNRGLVQGAISSVCQPLIGGQQTWPDNLVAILLNLATAGVFYWILRRDWRLITDRQRFVETRRVFRFVLAIYGLGLTVYGLHETLRFVTLLSSDLLGKNVSAILVDGAALILVGAPIWVYAWNACQAPLVEACERESRIRRFILYALALAGVPFALVMLGNLLDGGLRALLGDPSFSARYFLWNGGASLAAGLPGALVWAYYGYWLFRDLRAQPDLVRRSEGRRLYLYILSEAGLIISVIGVLELFGLLGTLVLFGDWLGMHALAQPLAGILALLLVGLPLWLVPWRLLQAEALAPDEAGDHARRALLRKIYLYAAAFASLVGTMILTVMLLTTLLEPAFLHQSLSKLDLFERFTDLTLFGILLAYHLVCLRRDGPRLGRWLSSRQQAYPVLVLDPGRGDFAARMVKALQSQAPLLPVQVLSAGGPFPVGKREVARAVLLPAGLAVEPSESLRRWLNKYPGQKIQVTEPVPGWTLGGLTVEQAARAAGQLAEGQEVRVSSSSNLLVIFLYILLGLAGIFVLLSLISTYVTF